LVVQQALHGVCDLCRSFLQHLGFDHLSRMTDNDRRQWSFRRLVRRGAVYLARERQGQDCEPGDTGPLQCD
jgi:hypothetical protein